MTGVSSLLGSFWRVWGVLQLRTLRCQTRGLRRHLAKLSHHLRHQDHAKNDHHDLHMRCVIQCCLSYVSNA